MAKGKGGFMKKGGSKTGGNLVAPKTNGLILSPAKPLGGKGGGKAR